MPRRRPLNRLADLLRSAAQAVDRAAGPPVPSPLTGPHPSPATGPAPSLVTGSVPVPARPVPGPRGMAGSAADATALPRPPGQPPEHWLRVVEAHAPGLLRDLLPDGPPPPTAAQAHGRPDDALVSPHATTTPDDGPHAAPGHTPTDPFALLQPTQRPLSGYRTPGVAWSEAEQRGVGEVARGAAWPHELTQSSVRPGESPQAVAGPGESPQAVAGPGESARAGGRPGGSARVVRPGGAGQVVPDGIDATAPRDGEAVSAYGAASSAGASGPCPADEDDEDMAAPRRLGGPDVGGSLSTSRLPASGRWVRAAGRLSSNRARLRDAGQPGAVPVPGQTGPGGWDGGVGPARGGRWLRAVDAGRTAADMHPAASAPPTGYESARPTADDGADRTPMSGHPRRPTDGHGYPGWLTDGPAPSSRVVGGRELTSWPTTGSERTGSPSVRYRSGGRALAGDGLWPGGGIPAGVEQTSDGKRFTGDEGRTGGEWAGGGGWWPDLDPSGRSDRRWRVGGAWPRLPDDGPLWSVPDAFGDDGAHRRRLDREQAGD